MRKILLFAIVIMLCSLMKAQNISQSGSVYNGNIYHLGGNIDIGTNIPGAKLDIQSGAIRLYNGGSSTATIEFKRISDSWNVATILQVYPGGLGDFYL